MRLGKIQIKKFDLNRKLNCVNCGRGKEQINGFRKKGRPAKLRTTRPGELVYSHPCVYTDAFTRLTATFLMKSKTQTLVNLKRYIAWMHNRSYNIQTLRTDQGTEYAYGTIKDFLRVNVITHALSGRWAHTKLYVAERMNRTMT